MPPGVAYFELVSKKLIGSINFSSISKLTKTVENQCSDTGKK